MSTLPESKRQRSSAGSFSGSPAANTTGDSFFAPDRVRGGDCICDDHLRIIAGFLDVPDILGFAATSREFNRIVVEGKCFKELALKLFPAVDKLYSSLPIGAGLSYTEKLRMQKEGMTPMPDRSDYDGDRSRKMRLQRVERVENELKNGYSFLVRSNVTLLEGEVSKLMYGVSKKVDLLEDLDIFVPTGEWDFRDDELVTLKLSFSKKDSEISLWPPMPGVPGEIEHETEKKRRQESLPSEVTDNLYADFSVFVVDKKTGKMARLLNTFDSLHEQHDSAVDTPEYRLTTLHFQEQCGDEELEVSEHAFVNYYPDIYDRGGGSGPKVSAHARYQITKKSVGGGVVGSVPKLKLKFSLVDLDVKFSHVRYSSYSSSSHAMPLEEVLDGFKRIFV